MSKYAVLLSGGINNKYNYPRYKNDLELVYKVLLEDCDYNQKNIKVFFANGKSLSYQTEMVEAEEARKEAILSYFATMENILTEEDSFTFIVSNHGSEEMGGCIHLWGRETLELKALVQTLNKIRAKKNIILGECYAGNILSMDICNACVVTANKAGEVSYAHPGDNKYDELLFHFFSFIHKQYPDGTVIEDGENNVIKAYEYALKKDAFHPDNDFKKSITYYGLKVEEIPQIKYDFLGIIRL